jgi:hypothetical protein
VSPALIALFALILAAPAILLVDGPAVYGPVAAIIAVGLAAAAWQIRPVDLRYLYYNIRLVIVVMTLPVLWFIVQVLPLPVANPIWQSAGAALGTSLYGSISIDTGSTLVSSMRYMSFLGLVLVAAVVGTDRQRAKWVLLALTAATAVISVMAIVPPNTGLGLSDANAGAVVDCAVLGVIFAIAAGISVLDRYEQRKRTHGAGNYVTLKLAACCLPLVLASVAVAINATGPLIFAASYGVAATLGVIAVRRLGLGPWGYIGLAGGAIAIALAIITVSTPSDKELTTAHASAASQSLVALTERISADRIWGGSGAGTFGDLIAIYQDPGDSPAAGAATAAAALVIEVGDVALLAFVAVALTFVIFLLQGAVNRGRDSFYSTAAASSVLSLTILLFVNAGVYNTSVFIIGASILGLGLAQNWSRTKSQ